MKTIRPYVESDAKSVGRLIADVYCQPQTPGERVLEDNGVIPDIEIALDRASLLQGRDTQLEVALTYMEKDVEDSARK